MEQIYSGKLDNLNFWTMLTSRFCEISPIPSEKQNLMVLPYFLTRASISGIVSIWISLGLMLKLDEAENPWPIRTPLTDGELIQSKFPRKW